MTGRGGRCHRTCEGRRDKEAMERFGRGGDGFGMAVERGSWPVRHGGRGLDRTGGVPCVGRRCTRRGVPRRGRSDHPNRARRKAAEFASEQWMSIAWACHAVIGHLQRSSNAKRLPHGRPQRTVRGKRLQAEGRIAELQAKASLDGREQRHECNADPSLRRQPGHRHNAQRTAIRKGTPGRVRTRLRPHHTSTPVRAGEPECGRCTVTCCRDRTLRRPIRRTDLTARAAPPGAPKKSYQNLS